MSKTWRWLLTLTLCCAALTAGSTVSLAQQVQQVDPLTGKPIVTEEPAPESEEPAVPQADLAEANELVRGGDYVRAEIALSGLQEEFPEDPRLQLMHGEVLLALSQPVRALPLLHRAVELAPERPRAHFQLATALQVTGDVEGALEEYAKEIDVNEDTSVRVMARLNRVLLLESRREWSAAAEELGAVLELDPARVEVYGDMASLYLQAGELDAAAGALDRGAENGFQSAVHHHSVAARYAAKEAFDAAIRAFRKALEIDPGLAAAERGLAAALDQAGQTDQALEHLRRYLDLSPTAPDADKVRQRIQELEGS